MSAGDFEYADDLEHSRMLNICAYSQIVMETSLKALIHALKGPHPANIHSIGGLIDAAGAQQALARCQHIQQELPNPDTPTRNRNLGIGPIDQMGGMVRCMDGRRLTYEQLIAQGPHFRQRHEMPAA